MGRPEARARRADHKPNRRTLNGLRMLFARTLTRRSELAGRHGVRLLARRPSAVRPRAGVVVGNESLARVAGADLSRRSGHVSYQR
jgi:hypothetical protein